MVLPIILNSSAGWSRQAQPSAYDGLIAAERAFSRDAGRIGISPAFRAHAAPDAVLIQPDPGPAAPLIKGPSDGPGTSLEWQPGFAGLARSKDLGFTTGPYRLRANGQVQHGQYLTVWQRRNDGPWKWYLDHGSLPAAGDLTAPFPKIVTRMKDGSRSEGAAANRATDADAALNTALSTNGPQSLLDVFATDGLLLRPGRRPMGRTNASQYITTGSEIVAAQQLAVRQSEAGDLAVSYGRMTIGAPANVAYYVRIWRHDREGWRLVIDELTWRRG